MKNELALVRQRMEHPPVDLFQVFQDLGVIYVRRPLPAGESSRLDRDGRNFRVTVNQDMSVQRRRFAAAHELAHYLLHRDLMEHGQRFSTHRDWLFSDSPDADPHPFTHEHDKSANTLAIQILMPGNLIRQLSEGGSSVESLSSIFEVTEATMAIRLRTLGISDSSDAVAPQFAA